MIDLNYIQNNLPPIEIQLEIFKSELEMYEYNFNFVTELDNTQEITTTSSDINYPQPPLDSDKQFWLADYVDWVFVCLADRIGFECTKRTTKEVNILLANSYLFPFQEGEEVKIKGRVRVYYE